MKTKVYTINLFIEFLDEVNLLWNEPALTLLYIQKQHHQKRSFESEYIKFMELHGFEDDE